MLVSQLSLYLLSICHFTHNSLLPHHSTVMSTQRRDEKLSSQVSKWFGKIIRIQLDNWLIATLKLKKGTVCTIW